MPGVVGVGRFNVDGIMIARLMDVDTPTSSVRFILDRQLLTRIGATS